MDVMMFDSHDDMTNHLREMRQAAKAGLHPEQLRLTLDDCWVEFVDPGARIIVFGRVHTVEEIRQGEDPDEVDSIITSTLTDLEDGLMYGRAHSRIDVGGELGYTHKANAWPIERRLFLMAQSVDFDVDELDAAGKMLMQIAYSAWRTHRLAVHE